MAKHETKAATIWADLPRPWAEVDPKVIAGLASSVTVGAVITTGAALGVTVPNWLAFLVVALVTFIASYMTKSRIPIADDSGLTARQAAVVTGAAAIGDELSDEDLQGAIREAFLAAGHALDEDGNVIEPPSDTTPQP